MLTDEQIIREIKEGNPAYYNELMKRYEKPIFSFVYHILKTYQLERLTEDICQEIFYKVFQRINEFKGEEASFKTWLYTVARNITISELRKKQNSEIMLDESFSRTMIGGSVETEILRNEQIKLVRKAIEKLPEKQRQAIILREYEDKNYKEIAELMDSTVSSIKSMLYRARNALKGYLENYIGNNHS